MTTEVKSSPPRGATVILALAAMAYALGQTAVIPGLHAMAQSLHTSSETASWILTGYLVAAAVLTPVMGRLGDMFGKRSMLMVALVFFGAGGAVAAVAPSIWIVVAARVLQGVGGGIFPLCFGIISDGFPPERRPAALGLISAIAGVGAGAGLLLGGLLIDHASYHWIFWSSTILAGLAIAGVRGLPGSGLRTPGKIDYAGSALLAVGITAPLIALTKTTQWGWGSARTLGLFAAGLAVLVLFGLFERRVKEPLVNMAVFARPTVLITNLATLLSGFAMFGAFVLIPQLAETPKVSGYGFGLSATGAALLLLPACLIMLAFGPLSGKLGLRFGARVPLIAGMLLSAAGLALLAAGHASDGTVIGFTIVVFAGVGLALAAMPNLIVGAVPHFMTGETTGVNALIRSLGSSIGSQVSVTLLAAGVTTAHPLPLNSAYTKAFAIGAGAAVIAGLAGLFIPPSSAAQVAAPPAGVAPAGAAPAEPERARRAAG
ncbi:MAG TPA: MFS transporter [Streptosporangiaceae bacterium]